MANRSNVMGLQFQFHKGTIRTFIQKCEKDHVCNFNSIKVQLEPDIGCISFRMPTVFQFHKGTIRTPHRGLPGSFTCSISIP